jgi:transcriptional regulator with XRE-family HTH domain
MPESFGARMRQHRERQQISLTTIAEQTKIKLSMLESMEQGDVSRWPSGIFRRAFMRSYARVIGLEPDVVVREFLDEHPDPVEEALTGAGEIEADGDGARATASAPPTRLRYVVGSAFAYLSRRRVEVSNPAAERPASIPPSPAVVFPPAVDEAPSAAEMPDFVDTSADALVHDEMVMNDVPTALCDEEPDLDETARLCTEIARVGELSLAVPLVEEAARLVRAVGIIAWQWEPRTSELRPALAYGYSDKLLAQLPAVRGDANNATAAAFRSAQTCCVNGAERESGALVVPMMAPTGCVGVLAAELPNGNERKDSVRAVLTIFAAQLARLVGGPLAAAAYRQAG